MKLDKIYTGDALSVLREQPADSVDLIVTDPPYQLSSITRRFSRGADEQGSKGAGEQGSG